MINLLDGIWSKIRFGGFSGTTIHWRPQRAGEVNQNDFSLHTQHPIDFPPLPNRRPIGARLNHDRSAVVSSQIRNSASPLITITRLTYHLGGLFAIPPPLARPHTDTLQQSRKAPPVTIRTLDIYDCYARPHKWPLGGVGRAKGEYMGPSSCHLALIQIRPTS